MQPAVIATTNTQATNDLRPTLVAQFSQVTTAVYDIYKKAQALAKAVADVASYLEQAKTLADAVAADRAKRSADAVAADFAERAAERAADVRRMCVVQRMP